MILAERNKRSEGQLMEYLLSSFVIEHINIWFEFLFNAQFM